MSDVARMRNMQYYKESTLAIADNKPVFIGKIIEEELRSQGRSVTWLSRQIHCDRRNIYDIFQRNSIDTSLLMRISRVLDVDFFRYFSQMLCEGKP